MLFNPEEVVSSFVGQVEDKGLAKTILDPLVKMSFVTDIALAALSFDLTVGGSIFATDMLDTLLWGFLWRERPDCDAFCTKTATLSSALGPSLL